MKLHVIADEKNGFKAKNDELKLEFIVYPSGNIDLEIEIDSHKDYGSFYHVCSMDIEDLEHITLSMQRLLQVYKHTVNVDKENQKT